MSTCHNCGRNLRQISPSPFPLPSREGIRIPSPPAGEGRVRGACPDHGETQFHGNGCGSQSQFFHMSLSANKS
jgi:hypothetical protein